MVDSKDWNAVDEIFHIAHKSRNSSIPPKEALKQIQDILTAHTQQGKEIE